MAYEFHYTPTGTGVISGKEVLEQTEDAINDLGNTAISGVQEALDKAEQALTNSENAVDDAQTALNTANNAEGVAIQAQNNVSNLSGTVTNIGNRVTTAEGNIGNLQGRMTTAEGNISNLQGRMTTAEGNITNLQTAVSTAQATANSAQQTATTARQQSYVFRYSSTALVASSTNSNTLLDNTDNLKVGDKVIDSSGVLFSITAIDTQNSTFTIGTALIDLAQDSDVVHKSGDETVGGIKSFSDDTYIKSLNFTNEVASTSSSSSSIMPLVTTVTYTDQTASKVARINLRITASGDKSLYPHEDNQYALGLTSRKWSEVHGVTYYYGSSDTEFSNKFVTTDTDQTISSLKTFSGLRTEFKRVNSDGVILFGNGSFTKGSAPNSIVNICRKYYGDSTSIGSALGYSSVSVDNNGNKTTYQFYCIDNTAGSTSSTTIQMNYDKSLSGTDAQYINISGSLLPSSDNSYNLGNSTNKWSTINGLNPSSLSLPDLNNGIDISGYITAGNNHNEYTPTVDGWISVALKSTSGACALWIYQNDLFNGYYGSTARPGETEPFAVTCLPVKANTVVNIDIKGSNTYIYSAKFFPCQGNV